MDRIYIKKAGIIFLVFLFVTASFGFVQGIKMQENSIYIIDQSNGASCVPCSGAKKMLLTEGFYIAQSFTPSHNILSRIVLTLKKSGSSTPDMKLTLFIRETLDGNDLVSMEKEIGSSELVFDIQDINVVPEKMYYMIITTYDAGSENNEYSWYYIDINSYSRGSCWTSYNTVTWSEEESYDMLFETYWEDYSPSLPTIEGAYNGISPKRYEYTFSTIDPDGDDVEYFIDWGDGYMFKWTGPYESGEKVIKSHSWTYRGNYTIRVKARDIYGAESDWNTMEITMQKNKVFIIPLLQFLENHQYLYHLLQHLLGLH